MPHHNVWGVSPIAFTLPDIQSLESGIVSSSHLTGTEAVSEHRPSGLTMERIRAFRRALDAAPPMEWNVFTEEEIEHRLETVQRLIGVSLLQVLWQEEDELEVDYDRDLDDEMPFTEALAALERIRDGVKK